MGLRKQVISIERQQSEYPHERIKSIGGYNSDASIWSMSQAEAIMAIESGELQFYVRFGGFENVIIIKQYAEYKYIGTKPDALGRDNLLTLNSCKLS